ncbi:MULTISPECIES: CheR family methyltransferase [Cellulomonas]|uniref:protein-glutamate O-methyltransferase n=1 Tax=Cellulomonas gelida TaxID=1712 RepID=A0A4Y3KQU8_9CELL|nr:MULTISPECIES: protein-glutamate O-methyltransferase CheR [Cellulomonas]GEA85966.1 chemotaxis protein methyltransferase [Cellulomonas gelida]GGL16639.1 chemotaxis protein methyltransferase [Cellulomonas gelida]
MSLTPESFAFVADLVARRSAIQLAPGKEYLVESRLLPLARDAGTDVNTFIAGLRAQPTSPLTTAVVEAMTTNETSWFRDGAPYQALRRAELPRLVAARGGVGRLRVWSAACSTGQEPYSLAMCLSDELPAAMTAEIVATDLSEQVLARARTGRYSQLEVNRGMPAQMLVQHLRRVGTEWEVADALRRMITFRAHNLLDVPPAGPFDVVFLRNVLIYFDAATKRGILDRVLRVLRPDGVLVLGAAETTLGVHDGWERVTIDRTSVYRPLGAPNLSSVPTPHRAPLAPTGTDGAPSPIGHTHRSVTSLAATTRPTAPGGPVR